jgi:hypothetical protein
VSKPRIHSYGNGVWVFHCPGCKYAHPFHIDPAHHPTNQSWKWNGSVELPTITPSLLIFKDSPTQRCHSFITDGRIRFLDDCFHQLKGQTVEIPDWED